jgi:hypothetical protein
MFWIALLGLSLSWMLAKLGFLSATVGIMSMVIKLLLIAILVGSIAAVWFWFRRKMSSAAAKQ